MAEQKALERLHERVLAEDLCAGCGACISVCPYLRHFDGRIVKLDPCDRSEGRCWDYCPRSEVDLDAIHRKLFGCGYEDVELGRVRRVLMARAVDPKVREKAQTGGVVSALIGFALDKGVVNAAVLTRRDKNHATLGCAVRSREEVLSCAGSSYVSGPSLEALNKGDFGQGEKIGLVGTPCQVLAFAKMRASGLEKRTPIDRVAMVIGLFCTWALSHSPFMKFLGERTDVSRIRKLDITPPPERLLKVVTDSETLDIPIDEIRSFIRTSCGVCADMTAELADVSVGTVEGLKGWNTVIIRSEQGEDLLKSTVSQGALETRPLPGENLAHLKQASLLKKKRALAALEERGELEDGYLKLSTETIQRIRSKA
ncbi:MAG: Coenzyme F420 hydrogenase/dehydrogenase, beta subunit C-terminal domain [Thermodesulfobacteriota bacterium]